MIFRKAYNLKGNKFKGLTLTPEGMVTKLSYDHDICLGIQQNDPEDNELTTILPLFSGEFSFVFLHEKLMISDYVTINKHGEVAYPKSKNDIFAGMLLKGGEAGELGEILLNYRGTFKERYAR